MGIMDDPFLSSLPGLIPILFFASVALMRMRDGVDAARAVIDAFLVWVTASFVIAEIAGIFRGIGFRTLMSAWTLLTSFVLIKLAAGTSNWRLELPRPHVPLIIVGVIVTVSFFIALVAEPTNWDGMAVYLPKIEHWIQNGSLEYYPTGMAAGMTYQNTFPGLAQTIMLHTRVLGSTDKFYPLIQWCAFVIALLSVYRITRQIGGSEVNGWVALIFVATLPNAILQSNSSQYDLTASALLCCFVSLAFELIEDVKQQKPSYALAIETMAAGILSGTCKPTCYIIGAGFAVWLVIGCVRRLNVRELARWTVAAVTLLAVLGSSTYIRNYREFGSFRAPGAAHILAPVWSVAGTLDSLILHTASHLATGYDMLDSLVVAAARTTTSVLGIDDGKRGEFALSRVQDLNNEDLCPNTLHTIIILLASSLLLFKLWRGQISRLVLTYWCAWFAGVVMFSMVFNWLIWNVRPTLPGFILAGPAVAMLWPGWGLNSLQMIVAVSLLAYNAWSPLLTNFARPLIAYKLPINHGGLFRYQEERSFLDKTRMERLFVMQRHRLKSYQQAVEVLGQTKARNIGLIVDDWEYPLWRMLRDQRFGYPIRIEHVQFERESGGSIQIRPDGMKSGMTWPLGPFVPDAIFWGLPNPPPEIRVGTEVLSRRPPLGPLETGGVAVYVK